MFYGATAFAEQPFSSYSIDITVAARLDIISEFVATGTLSGLGGVSQIEAIAVLTADGTLSVSETVTLEAIAEIVANATMQGVTAKVFVWTIEGRATTWNL